LPFQVTAQRRAWPAFAAALAPVIVPPDLGRKKKEKKKKGVGPEQARLVRYRCAAGARTGKGRGGKEGKEKQQGQESSHLFSFARAMRYGERRKERGGKRKGKRETVPETIRRVP